ncbi:chromate resistance protein ChrB domain-containing protein [Microbulbifer epialgicus]|uniref:Chromate resistance protein ChrB domain-containing protein n=1 Tax=Microbulbifer epialgicus TaxID=393907 RepID=A0ABV4P4V2_9GAMM
MSSIFRTLSVLAILTFIGCSKPQSVFVTEYGLGPDKWATAWLLTRHADPKASLKVVNQGSSLSGGVEFDTPTASIRRIGDQTAFEMAKSQYTIDDPIVLKLVGIIHDIEVNFWGADKTQEAEIVESAFRALQEKYGRDSVPANCYLDFFDSVYAALSQVENIGSSLTQAGLMTSCNREVSTSNDALVSEISISTILAEMQKGKTVAFVDVREEEEFLEGHIPNALNITLRDLDSSHVKGLLEADYVVSYCVKDFRGFEMAKALKVAGVEHSVILNPYGIKGWIAQGLPTVGTRALKKEEALKQLERCVSKGQCPKSSS